MVDSYLDVRTLIIETSESTLNHEMTAGVPQGSVMGPDLWNADYDGLLEIPLPQQVQLTGFADDIAATIVVDCVEEAAILVGSTINAVASWLDEHQLKLTYQKTEMVVLTRQRWFPEPFRINIDGLTLTSTKSARYLGVRLDTKLTFREHLDIACAKASKTASSLSRIMANTIGPRTKKRKALLEVIHSVLLYGAEIWAHTLEQKTYRKKIAAVQRRGALRVACAYRTVSEAAVLVIAGAPPIDLLAKERATLYDQKSRSNDPGEKKTKARAETLREWQDRWRTSDRGRWTARLIPNIETWLTRKHGETDFYLTQMLTGHGSFNAYLFRMGLHNSPSCRYCPYKIDDAEHTFFECVRWKNLKSETEMTLGMALNPQCLIKIMLESEENWNEIAAYAQRLLRAKNAERGQ